MFPGLSTSILTSPGRAVGIGVSWCRGYRHIAILLQLVRRDALTIDTLPAQLLTFQLKEKHFDSSIDSNALLFISTTNALPAVSRIQTSHESTQSSVQSHMVPAKRNSTLPRDTARPYPRSAVVPSLLQLRDTAQAPTSIHPLVVLVRSFFIAIVKS